MTNDRSIGAYIPMPDYFRTDDVPPISPDCAAGKCRACHGDAWNFKRDELAVCTHECHTEANAA